MLRPVPISLFRRTLLLKSSICSGREVWGVRGYSEDAFKETETPPIPPPSPVGEDRVYSPRVVAIVDQIAQLSLLDVADLNRLIKKRFDLPDAAPMMYGAPMAAAPSASKTEDSQEEDAAPKKTSFAVKLLKFDDGKKIQLIKEVKTLVPGLNLVQAKNFVESLPQTVRGDIGKDEADELVKKLEAVGGKAEIE